MVSPIVAVIKRAVEVEPVGEAALAPIGKTETDLAMRVEVGQLLFNRGSSLALLVPLCLQSPDFSTKPLLQQTVLALSPVQSAESTQRRPISCVPTGAATPRP